VPEREEKPCPAEAKRQTYLADLPGPACQLASMSCCPIMNDAPSPPPSDAAPAAGAEPRGPRLHGGDSEDP
jgi:hypothetical protein